MTYLVEIIERLRDAEFEVLRRDLVGDVDRAHQIVRDDDLTVVINGSAGDLSARQLRNLGFQFLLYGESKVHRIRHKDGRRELVVLRLREQVRCDKAWIAVAVGNDQDLARSGNHVDRHRAENLLFRFGDKGVARTDDLIHLRDALGAVGQCGDRLRAADLEDLVDPRDVRRGKDHGVDLPLFVRRGHHHDRFDAGDLRRNRVHQHRRRIRRRPAGHIKPRTVDRNHLLTDHDAVKVVEDERVAYLPLVKFADIRRRLFEDLQKARFHQREGFLYFFRRHGKTGQFRLVKALRVGIQGAVAVPAHGRDDLFHHAADVHRRLRPGKDRAVFHFTVF